MIVLALAALAALPGLAPGATVTLGPGPYDLIAFRGEHYDPPVTIKAGKTIVNGLRIWDSSGIIWKGGIIKAPGGRDGNGPNVYGADVRRTDRLTFDGTTFTESLRGAVVADSTNLTVRNSSFVNLRSDGLDLAGNSDVLVERNRFTDFSPVKPTGSKADGTYKDGDHPDAIQIWNTPTSHASANIVIRQNIIDGDTQGINFFGPRFDGYRQVTVDNNDIRLTFPAAISLLQCSECTIRNNKITQVPGSRFKPNIRFDIGSTGNVCGNTMPAAPAHVATQKCKSRNAE